MARKKTVQNNFNFANGFITESNDITAPEASAKDMLNMHILDDGSMVKRKGITSLGTGVGGIDKSGLFFHAVKFGRWTNPNHIVSGLPVVTTIARVGRNLLFFNSTDLSYIGFYDISVALLAGKTVAQLEASNVSFKEVNGKLIVVSSVTEPAQLDGTRVGTLYNNTTFVINIRDTDGAPDTQFGRLATLSADHNYNLINQGWINRNVSVLSGSANPITNFFNSQGVYPSDSDIVWLGKVQNASTANDIGKFDPTWLIKNAFGNTLAPRGSTITNAFNIDRNAVVAGATNTVISSRPDNIEYFAGRVWYGGTLDLSKGVRLFFSQVIRSDNEKNKCYQDNDPTSEIPDLLATDGGVIYISNASTILHMLALKGSLLVFTDTGIWELRGIDGFSADGFSIEKISDLVIASASSVTLVEDLPIFWTKDDIYAGKRESVTGKLLFSSLSDGKIQTVIDTITYRLIQGATSTYDPSTSLITFTFQLTDAFDSTLAGYVGLHNIALQFNIKTKAFSKFDFKQFHQLNNTYRDHCIIGSALLNTASIEYAGDPRGPSRLRFLGIKNAFTATGNVSFTTLNNTSLFDWSDAQYSYRGYWYSNPIIFEDISRDKQIIDLSMVCKNPHLNEGSIPTLANHKARVKIGVRWDWRNSTLTAAQEGFRVKTLPELKQTAVVTKIKPRGKGNELALRFDDVALKDMHIEGFSMTVSGETRA